MAEYHLVQVFHVPDSAQLFDQCDALMGQLMDMEDESVRDAAVSADVERRLATVEVTTSGHDEVAAEFHGLKRIHEAMLSAGIPIHELKDRREMGVLTPA
jgi:hypothetical protein